MRWGGRASAWGALALLGRVVATAWASGWLVLILLTAGWDEPVRGDELARASVGMGIMTAAVVLPWCLRRTAIIYLAALGLAAVAASPALLRVGAALPAAAWAFVAVATPSWSAAAALLAAYALARDGARSP